MKFTYRVTLEISYIEARFDFDSKSDALGFAEDAKRTYIPEKSEQLQVTIEPLIRDETDN